MRYLLSILLMYVFVVGCTSSHSFLVENKSKFVCAKIKVCNKYYIGSEGIILRENTNKLQKGFVYLEHNGRKGKELSKSKFTFQTNHERKKTNHDFPSIFSILTFDSENCWTSFQPNIPV